MGVASTAKVVTCAQRKNRPVVVQLGNREWTTVIEVGTRVNSFSGCSSVREKKGASLLELNSCLNSCYLEGEEGDIYSQLTVVLISRIGKPYSD